MPDPNSATATAEMPGELSRLRSLESAVKRVLAQEGDDHCWRDAYTELASIVGVEWKPKVLDKPTMLRNCEHFVDCLLSGEHHVTPTVTRAEHDAKVAELMEANEAWRQAFHMEATANADMPGELEYAAEKWSRYKDERDKAIACLYYPLENPRGDWVYRLNGSLPDTEGNRRYPTEEAAIAAVRRVLGMVEESEEDDA